jgi:hypothetical protein
MKRKLTDAFLRALAVKGEPGPAVWDTTVSGFGARPVPTAASCSSLAEGCVVACGRSVSRSEPTR